MIRVFRLFAVGLPILALAGGVVRAELHLAEATDWYFDISGYDPRDPLKGHYIRYRVVFDEDAAQSRQTWTGSAPACTDAEPNCCLCLTRQGTDVPPRVSRAVCSEARQHCDGMLRSDQLKKLRRFYVPEDRAKAWQDQLRRAKPGEARILVAIDTDGRPMVKDLTISSP